MNTQKKTKLILIIALIVAALALTGCERSYDPIDESLATPTAEGDGFAEALPGDDINALVEAGAQTAAAESGEVPAAAAEEAPPATVAPEDDESATEDAPAEDAADPPTATVTAPVVDPTAAPPTAVVGKPSTYTLQKGEFPYCIARRFNVDPKELLSLNGLASTQGQTYYSGMTLTIPQSGAAFPPPRNLSTHPGSYTLDRTMSVYAVACLYGDVDPADIVAENTIADVNNIPSGTTLSIP